MFLYRARIQFFFFFFKQKTAYEMRISDWSSDVCSSDLARNVAAAWHYVSALQAEGGTEMRPALERALAGAPADGVLQQVVFLTDGAVGNEEQLFGIVAERLGAQRLFTVGIGSAPHSYFMLKAAEVGRGSFTHLGDLREVKPRMDALFAKLEQPALTDIRVGWPLAAGKRIDRKSTRLNSSH